MIPSQFLPSDKKNKILGMFKGEFGKSILSLQNIYCRLHVFVSISQYFDDFRVPKKQYTQEITSVNCGPLENGFIKVKEKLSTSN